MPQIGYTLLTKVWKSNIYDDSYTDSWPVAQVCMCC